MRRAPVSIVILAWNAWDETQACLESLRPTLGVSDQVILVDNGSTDGTGVRLRAYPWVHVLTNVGNRGFAAGCNQGAEAAEHETIVFLNNDTILAGRWLDPLVAPFCDIQVGATGPRSNFVSGPQLVGATSYAPGDRAGLRDFARSWATAHRGEESLTTRLVGFCMAVRRSAFQGLGGFDEGFEIGGYEDDDLCQRLLHRGLQLVIAHESYVHHSGHRTFDTNNVDWYAQQQRNRARFDQNTAERRRAIPSVIDLEARTTRARELAGSGQLDAAADELLGAMGLPAFDAPLLGALVEDLEGAGRSLSEIADHVPAESAQTFLAQVLRLPDTQAERLLATCESGPIDHTTVLAAAASLALRLPVERALPWAMKLRAAGYVEACPLLGIARGERPFVDRARAAAAVHRVFADERGAPALYDALRAAPAWDIPVIVAEASQICPELLEGPESSDLLQPLHASAPPRVSIVIPCFDKVELTMACLQSIGRNTDRRLYEVIVVDNGSTDATRQLSHLVGPGFRVIRNEDNTGFGPASNQGAREASGELLLFLNNNTVVLPGWLEPLLVAMDEDPLLGAVQPKLLFPDGRLNDAGGLVFEGGAAWVYGKGSKYPDAPQYSSRRSPDYASGACLLVRKTAFEQVGGFDDQYAPASYEDTDLSFSLRGMGWDLLYEPASRVVHVEGGTAGTDVSTGLKAYQVRNAARFAAKWAEDLSRRPSLDPSIVERWAHRPNPRTPEGRSILVIDQFMPVHDRAAGSLRLFTLLMCLREQGHAVTFYTLSGGEGRYADDLARLGIPCYGTLPARSPEQLEDALSMYRPSLESLLLRYRYDTVILTPWTTAELALDLVRSTLPDALVVVDTIDVHFARLERAAALENSAQMKQQALETRRRELATYRRADRIVCVTDVDAALVRDEIPGADVVVMPTAHAAVDPGPGFEGRSGLLFVGNFLHPPNIDAIQWWKRDIAGHLPGVELDVVGNDPAGSAAGLAGDGVHVTGWVPSTTPYLHAARVSVAPLRYGAGIKGKVGESLAAGLPTVATSMAVEGMGLVDGLHVLIADTPEEFVQAVTRLDDDKMLWNRLRAAGRAYVIDHFGIERMRRAIPELLDQRVKREQMAKQAAHSVGDEGRRVRISLAVNTRNEAHTLPAMLSSVDGVDEMVVADMASTDATVEIAVGAGAGVIELPNLGCCELGRQTVIDSCSGDWLLLLDGDERLSENGIERLRELARDAPASTSAYRLPFHT